MVLTVFFLMYRLVMSLNIKLFGNRYYLKTHQALWFTIIIDEEISVLPVYIELSVFLGHFSFGTHFMLKGSTIHKI